jgi:SAM-dependent methyltransferase
MGGNSMDERLNKVAALANIGTYDSEGTRKYTDGAPHIKHASLRSLYAKLLIQVYDDAAKRSDAPRILDLGAGEGSVTLPFLELGARVTAVDISNSQLDALRKKCERFSYRLELRCEDMSEILKLKWQQYDVIVVNSFLHHIPDYLGMIRESIVLLKPHGHFFSFQDPLRYDTIGEFTKNFSDLAYLSWRIFKGDIWAGLKRRIRRSRGFYLVDSIHDNTEYHVIRNGVDQDAIADLLEDAGFQCRIIRYFSTQSQIFQPIGAAMGLKNTFAIIARKGIKD